LSLNWVPLTYAYKSNGYIQTAINQIVDDAFAKDGLIINSKTLEDEELEQLKQALEDNDDIVAIKNVIRWGELYGGGVLIANTEQDYELPLDEKQLKGKKLKFIAADRWQCYQNGISPRTAPSFVLTDNILENQFQGGITIDRSRVEIFTRIEAPYLLRAMLQGWGLSIFESIIPPLTQFMKAMGVTLELLDEAKIDVIKIFDLANSLLSPDGEAAIKRRLQIVTENKNYKSSIAMDSQDDYQQKQITFSGLPEMIEKIQYLICAAIRRPYSKVFGKGGNGLSEQTSDLENYASIVDAEIRQPAKKLIKWVIDLRCLQLFGRKLPDLKISWKPIRSLSEEEEADIKDKAFARYMQLFDRRLMNGKAVATHLTQEGIVTYTEDEIEDIDEDFIQNDFDNVEDLSEA
jgi:phage-related protein (TIGR01555 family)